VFYADKFLDGYRLQKNDQCRRRRRCCRLLLRHAHRGEHRLGHTASISMDGLRITGRIAVSRSNGSLAI
jgi:hypothetical protein